MIKLFFIFVLVETFFFLISKKIRDNFQWFILKKTDLYFSFNKNLVLKFKKDSFDKILGWRPRKNTKKIEEVKSLGEDKKSYKCVSYNFGNLTERKNVYLSKRTYISTFGDSFVFCKHVDDNFTWQNYLSKKTNSNVYNFGVNNYGVDQSLLRYIKIKNKIKSKIVIIGIVPETLVRIRSKWKHFYEYGNILGFKPSFELDNKDNLFLKNNPLKNPDNLLNKNDKIISKLKTEDYWFKNKFLKDLIQFPYSLTFFKKSKRNINILINFILYWITGSTKFRENAWNVILNENYNLLKKRYNKKQDIKLLTSILKKFINEIKKQKSIPIVVVFPYKKDIIEYKKYKKNFYIEYFSSLKKKKNMNILDLTKNISSLKFKDLDKFYHSNFYGSHFTGYGNKICANYIYKYIKRFKIK